jgi:hypothetical protein
MSVEILRTIDGRLLGLDKDANLVLGGTKLIVGHSSNLDQIIDLLALGVANSSIPNAVGDGVTDDSAALASAVTVTAIAGGTLQIATPLLINANQTVPANVQLQFIGRGILKPASGKTITINGPINAGAWQIFDISAGGTISGNLRNDRVYAEWFGAVADATTDCTTAINKALALAHAASDIPVQLLAGTYVVTDTLVATGLSFTRPNLMGVSKKKTVLNFSTAPDSIVCVKIRGGSGQITGDAISDLTLTGNSTSILLEFNGACGSKARNVLFLTSAVGVRWHNEAASSFTEFCTLEGCEWQNACVLPMEYKVTSGNNSFHGSGPGGGAKNVVSNNNGTVVKVDGTGCFVYNAPCNLQVFATTANTTIFQNNNSVAPIPIAFSGALSIETNSSQTITLGAGAGVYFAGAVKIIGLTTSTGANVVAGTFQRVETVTVHADSSTSFTGGKLNQQVSFTTGANTVSSTLKSVSRLAHIIITASNYDYRYILAIDRDSTGGNGFVATLGTLRTFNTAGYGAPTFSADTNGNLVVTNASFPASGVSAYLSEAQLATGIQGSGHMQF